MIFYLNTADSGYSYHACEYSTYLVKVQYENEFCSPWRENPKVLQRTPSKKISCGAKLQEIFKYSVHRFLGFYQIHIQPFSLRPSTAYIGGDPCFDLFHSLDSKQNIPQTLFCQIREKSAISLARKISVFERHVEAAAGQQEFQEFLDDAANIRLLQMKQRCTCPNPVKSFLRHIICKSAADTRPSGERLNCLAHLL